MPVYDSLTGGSASSPGGWNHGGMGIMPNGQTPTQYAQSMANGTYTNNLQPTSYTPTASTINQYNDLMNPSAPQPQQPTWNASLGSYTNNSNGLVPTQQPMASTASVNSMMNYTGLVGNKQPSAPQQGYNPYQAPTGQQGYNPYQPPAAYQGTSSNQYGAYSPMQSQYGNSFGQGQNQSGLTSLFGRY